MDHPLAAPAIRPYPPRGSIMSRSILLVTLSAVLGGCHPATLPPSAAEGGRLLGRSEADCLRPRVDADDDGLDDACELALARSFAPLLVVRPGACEWREDADGGRLGGGYLFAVRARRAGRVRIAYLPAYFRDCGWSGPKCGIPLVRCDPHPGDSEMIIVDAVPAGEGRWRTEAVFLSAHCFGSSDACRWYRGDELRRFEWVDGESGGAPVVWVAAGKHANYPSRAACDRGYRWMDSCDGNDARYRFPILSPAQNIGSPERPVRGTGCLDGHHLVAARPPAEETTECFWSLDAPFRGWTGEGPGVTPYARYLFEIGGF